MWLQNAWYMAAWSDEIRTDEVLSLTIIDQPLVLFRNSAGAVSCLEDRCCHRFAPLSKGRLEQGHLRCMYHGMKFAANGRCVEIPGQSSIPKSAKVRCYPVADQSGRVWIWMGDAAAADPALVPETVPLSGTKWAQRTGTLDFAADYQLLNDNLLDLSHLTFVHENTLGRGSPTWADDRPTITTQERGLRIARWNRNDPGIGLRQYGSLFDVWNIYDFLVPGVFLQRTQWYAPGTADTYDGGAPNPEQLLFQRMDEQAVTPMTARSTRYFFAAGAVQDTVSDSWLDKNLVFSRSAFLEDRIMIEAQQAVIDRTSDHIMVPTTFDAGPIQFRRILEKLMAQERPSL